MKRWRPSGIELHALRMQGVKNTMEGQCELTEVQKGVRDCAEALGAILAYIATKERAS
jgi:hypothetical protein